MKQLLIVPALPIAAIAASRGSGAANLDTRDPKEAWADSAVGSAVTFTVDLGAARAVDTIALVAVRPPTADATWSIGGGAADAGEAAILGPSPLRVPDVAGYFPETSLAVWHAVTPVTVRYLAITVSQPAGAPLTIGRLLVGRAFVTARGKEWGSGRRPIDTGAATALASGGFAAGEGVRKR